MVSFCTAELGVLVEAATGRGGNGGGGKVSILVGDGGEIEEDDVGWCCSGCVCEWRVCVFV